MDKLIYKLINLLINLLLNLQLIDIEDKIEKITHIKNICYVI